MPFGMITAHVRPAAAAYAAADALVLPVDAHTIAVAPSSSAFDTASVIPRSLKDPVGLVPSYLRNTSAPVSREREAERTSGVPPSWSVTTGVSGPTGSRARYSSITPRQGGLARPDGAGGSALTARRPPRGSPRPPRGPRRGPGAARRRRATNVRRRGGSPGRGAPPGPRRPARPT